MAFKLTKKEKVENLLNKSRETGLCYYLKLHPDCIKYIPKDKRNINYIKTAIESDGNVFQLLDNDEKTLEICTLAIKRNINNLRFVPEEFKTNDFLIYAISCNHNALGVIDDPSEELCLAAMDKDPNSIFLINNKTEKIMLKAVKLKGLYKHKDMPQFYTAVLEYVRENGNSLQYIKKELKTFELCKVSILNSPFAMKYVPKKILREHPELEKLV